LGTHTAKLCFASPQRVRHPTTQSFEDSVPEQEFGNEGFEESTMTHDEYQLARTACVLFDQSDRAKIELTGNDAASFLHNLCTNDIAGMPLGAGCEFFLTTSKAKVIAHGFAYHVRLGSGASALWLDAEPGTAETIIKHLDHFVISEQVEFADRTHEFAQFHLAGPQAHAVLEKALLDDVPDLEQLQHMERTFGSDATSHIRCRDPLGVPGYDVVCLRARAETVRSLLLRAGAQPASAETFTVLRVEAGTPVWGADIDETTFAPEVGRIAQAICYTKGCYLGQEPIVMARDRGQVNRTLLGVALPAGVVPRGSTLWRDGKEVGRVMTSVVSPRASGAIGLAYVRRGSQEMGTKLEVDAGGERRVAEVVKMPVEG
jgi:folate-binding protein YgfZ